MFLQYKSFDLTASIALVAALAYLVERPSARRYFLAGVVIGLVAILGRNHGIYGLIGGLGVIGYLILCNRAGGTFYSILIWWIAGVFVGYIPMLLALALVPGWAAAFWDGIRFLFEIKSTNISPPIPWPSLKPIVGLLPFTVSNPTAVVLIGNVVGLFFIALPTFGGPALPTQSMRGSKMKQFHPLWSHPYSWRCPMPITRFLVPMSSTFRLGFFHFF